MVVEIPVAHGDDRHGGRDGCDEIAWCLRSCCRGAVPSRDRRRGPGRSGAAPVSPGVDVAGEQQGPALPVLIRDHQRTVVLRGIGLLRSLPERRTGCSTSRCALPMPQPSPADTVLKGILRSSDEAAEDSAYPGRDRVQPRTPDLAHGEIPKTAIRPFMWSGWGWERTTRSMVLMPRSHRYGASTLRPMSNRLSRVPPPSIRMVPPVRGSTTAQSPCPTSTKVTCGPLIAEKRNAADSNDQAAEWPSWQRAARRGGRYDDSRGRYAAKRRARTTGPTQQAGRNIPQRAGAPATADALPQKGMRAKSETSATKSVSEELVDRRERERTGKESTGCRRRDRGGRPPRRRRAQRPCSR